MLCSFVKLWSSWVVCQFELWRHILVVDFCSRKVACNQAPFPALRTKLNARMPISEKETTDDSGIGVRMSASVGRRVTPSKMKPHL
jgi:hypothetical protein